MHLGVDGSRCVEEQATGVERYASLLLPPLIDHLSALGHRITVYSHIPLTIPFPHAHHRVIALPRLWTHLGLGLAAILDRVDRLFIPAHVLPLLRPRSCAIVLHDACFEEVPDAYSFLDRWYLRITTADALRSARVITHSPVSYRALLRSFHADPHAMTIVPPAAMPVGAARVAIPWPKPFLLFLGRIETRKNVGVLLRAFDQLLHTRPELPHHLILLGKSGYGAEAIHALHETLSCRQRVHFRGYADDPLRDTALRTASGLILPSVCEGSSLVLLEARMARLAFASSAHPACREAGSDEGIYVAQGEHANAWVEALQELIDRPHAPALPPERTWEDVARDVAEILTERPLRHGKNR